MPPLAPPASYASDIYIYIYIYITGVGSVGGGGQGRALFYWGGGGNGMFVPPTFNPTINYLLDNFNKLTQMAVSK